jgi:hypothetical protein
MSLLQLVDSHDGPTSGCRFESLRQKTHYLAVVLVGATVFKRI